MMTIYGPLPKFVYFMQREVESPKHIFLHCSFIDSIWNHFFSKMGRMWIWPNDLKDFVWQWCSSGQGVCVKVFWECLMHGVMWAIWRERNFRLFKDKSSSPKEVIDMIVKDVSGWVLMAKEFQRTSFSLLLYSWSSLSWTFPKVKKVFFPWVPPPPLPWVALSFTLMEFLKITPTCRFWVCD